MHALVSLGTFSSIKLDVAQIAANNNVQKRAEHKMVRAKQVLTDTQNQKKDWVND